MGQGTKDKKDKGQRPLSTISVGILNIFKTIIVRPWQADVLKIGLQPQSSNVTKKTEKVDRPFLQFFIIYIFLTPRQIKIIYQYYPMVR